MGSTLTVDNIVGATTAANVKLPAGTILQTVRGEYRTYTTFTSTSFKSGVSICLFTFACIRQRTPSSFGCINTGLV